MGFLDSLTWQLLGGSRSELAVYNAVMDHMRTHQGWLPNVVQHFSDAGLSRLVASWVGTGANLPVTSHEIAMGLGRDMVAEIGHRSGMSEEEAVYQLTKLLPRIIDTLTPDGVVPTHDPTPDRLPFPGGLIL